jgi:hypothetical protein
MMNPAMAVTQIVGEIERIKQVAPLSDADIARATGTNPETVGSWRAGRVAPDETRTRRLVELREVVEHAARVVKTQAIPAWLNRPMPRLEGQTMSERIAAGAYRDALGVIGELEYPTFT